MTAALSANPTRIRLTVTMTVGAVHAVYESSFPWGQGILMAEAFRFIASGVWSIYITRQGGKRLLDGEETDSRKAQHLFHLAIRDEPVTTLVELVNPAGYVVDRSEGARFGQHSTLTH